MPCDERKTVGLFVCPNVVSTQRAIYKKEEFEAQNTSKRSSDDHDLSCSPRIGGPSTQGNGFSPMQSCGKTISDFLDQGGRDNVDSKVYRFLYACSIPFNVLRSLYWHEMVQAINGTPKGYRSPKQELWDLIGKESKSIMLLESLQMIGPTMGYPLYLMARQMLKESH